MSADFVVSGEVVSSVYGPVKSRRHGLSLGVNVGLTHHKVCTWSCLYCQCGFGERREYKTSEHRIELNALLDQIKFEVLKHPDLDVVTLAGNTEPSTYPEIFNLIKGLKKLKLASRGKWKIVILSNGSELDRSDVRDALNSADETWLKLDVGIEELFQLLNRPIAKVGSLSDHLMRLKKINNLRIQTLIWSNEKDVKLSNSNEENYQGLLECYLELNPIQIHLTTVARDPALPGIVPVKSEELQALAERIKMNGIEVEVLI